MALSNDPVFPQTPKFNDAVISAANTNLDGTGTIVTLATMGADGGLVTSVVCWATVTSTAKRVNLFVSTDAGVTWKLLTSGLMAAFTIDNTTVQTPVTLVDKLAPNGAVRLPASAVLGCTIMVAEAVVFASEHTDF